MDEIKKILNEWNINVLLVIILIIVNKVNKN
jgi:hypothetical protein